MKRLTMILLVVTVLLPSTAVGGRWNSWLPQLSVYPLYAEEDAVVFVPELLGTWQEDPQTFLLFETKHNKSYSMTFKQEERSSRYEVRLVRLGNYLFADITSHYNCCRGWWANEIYQPSVPVHVFGRLQVDGDVLRFSTWHDPWPFSHCGEFDSKSPEAGPACVNTEMGTLLVVPTAELRVIVLQHAEDLFPFSDDDFLHRVATEP